MEILNNLFVGISSLENLNPESIISEYINLNTNGFGKLYIYTSDIAYTYNGPILNGKMNGHGLIIYIFDKINSTYKSYNGNIVDDLFDGYGILTYTNNDIFIGNFSKGLKNGSGKMYNSNYDIIMDHIWLNNIVCGKVDYIDYYHQTKYPKVIGQLYNSIKINTWLYIHENNIVDKIDYYNDNVDQELLLKKLLIHNTGYIINQCLSLNTLKLSDEDLCMGLFNCYSEKIIYKLNSNSNSNSNSNVNSNSNINANPNVKSNSNSISSKKSNKKISKKISQKLKSKFTTILKTIDKSADNNIIDEYIDKINLILDSKDDKTIDNKYQVIDQTTNKIIEQIIDKNIDFDQLYSIAINIDQIQIENHTLILYMNAKGEKTMIKEIINGIEYNKLIYLECEILTNTYKCVIYKNTIDDLTNNVISKTYIYELKNKNNNQIPILYYEGEINSLYQPNGIGCIYMTNQQKLSGHFENGTIISGTLSMNDIYNNLYISYNGSFKFLIPDGEGIFYNSSNIKLYEGQIQNNKRNGHGISYWESTSNINWNGMWKNNMKHGKGILFDDNGTKICTCFHNNDQITDILD